MGQACPLGTYLAINSAYRCCGCVNTYVVFGFRGVKGYTSVHDISGYLAGASMAELNINGEVVQLEFDDGTPLLWVLREQVGLTGSKYGCGIAQCGACTVHVDGKPVRSCIFPAQAVRSEQKITTIEGLSADGSHPVQQAWAELDVPQCGFCQSGMIMAAAALLATNAAPSDEEINSGMTNICRCGTLPRVRAGIHRAAELAQEA